MVTAKNVTALARVIRYVIPLTSHAVTGFALIFTRICVVVGKFAVNPAATTQLAKNASVETACHVLVILAAIRSWGSV